MAAAGAVAVTLTLGSSPPAYAVAQAPDGDIIVTIHRLDDAAGLENALRAKGVDAYVDYDADPGPHPRPRPDTGTGTQAGGLEPASAACDPPDFQFSGTDDSFTLRLPASAVDWGGVFHITTGGGPGEGIGLLNVWASMPPGC